MLSFNRVCPVLTYLSFVFVLAFVPLGIGVQARADVITEPFVVNDDDFFFGVAGIDPGDFSSVVNQFQTGPANSGGVLIVSPHELLSGFGDVRFKADVGPETRVNFNLGDVEATTLPGATLLGTEFLLSGIDPDPDSGNFSFEMTANFLTSGAANQVSDFDISATNANVTIAPIDEGLFGVTVVNTGVSPASLRISGAGDILNSLNFRGFSPDVLNDELTIGATRTLNFNAVPEPTATAAVALGLMLVIGRRRRKIGR